MRALAFLVLAGCGSDEVKPVDSGPPDTTTMMPDASGIS